MPGKDTPWRPTLYLTIGTYVTALLLLSGLIALGLTYYSSSQTLVASSKHLMTQVGFSTRLKLEHYFSTASSQIDLSSRFINDNIVEFEKPRDLEPYFFSTMATQGNISAISYGDVNGNFIMLKREQDGSIWTKLVNPIPDDPDGQVKTVRRYRDPGMNYLQIDLLDETVESKKIAFDPRTRPWFEYWMQEIKDPNYSEELPRYRIHPEVTYWTDVYTFFEDKRPGVTASRCCFDEEGNLVGVIVPQDEFLGSMKEMALWTIGMIIAVIAVGFLSIVFFARIIARTLRSLIKEANAVQALDFEDIHHKDSVFQEIHDVLAAFDKMKSGLRSFERYAPSQMVRLLMENQVEPELGGEEKIITVLFTDVQNFTTMSEHMSPQMLALDFGEYLSTMSKSIRDNQGLIDKFIGDGVMAFWGAPQRLQDHAVMACRAVISAREEVKKLNACNPDFPDFYTRFGLHTGTAIVGNFGSRERLSFTCFGDAVNLSSRLEGLNKYYGTQILISEKTWHQLDGQFFCRRLDKVSVYGRSQGLMIFELIDHVGEADPMLREFVNDYEQGLDAYLQCKWEVAIAHFENALAMRPEDIASQQMIHRCEQFAEHQPDDEWDGAYSHDSKY